MAKPVTTNGLDEAWNVTQEYDCAISAREQYLVHALRSESKVTGVVKKCIKVFHTVDSGASWIEVPLRACLKSYFSRHAADWPPNEIRGARVSGNSVAMTFLNEWYPYNKPIIPWLDSHSLWEATYQPVKKCWSLRRLKYLE